MRNKSKLGSNCRNSHFLNLGIDWPRVWHLYEFWHEWISEYICINKYTQMNVLIYLYQKLTQMNVRINICIENFKNIRIYLNIRLMLTHQHTHGRMSEYIHINKFCSNIFVTLWSDPCQDGISSIANAMAHLPPLNLAHLPIWHFCSHQRALLPLLFCITCSQLCTNWKVKACTSCSSGQGDRPS